MAVLDAAEVARSHPSIETSHPLVLSVGATPTAHAFSEHALSALQSRLNSVGGDTQFELHAGNYPMLDLQQLATSLIPLSAISQRVLASVVSYYPGRGDNGKDEAMCDAGGVALSKDTGPIPGYGDVYRIHRPGSVSSSANLGCEATGWRIGRTSQEHGILTRIDDSPIAETDALRVGDMVEVVGQHACYISAAYPWYYIIDSSAQGGGDAKVVDIWVPYKGW